MNLLPVDIQLKFSSKGNCIMMVAVFLTSPSAQAEAIEIHHANLANLRGDKARRSPTKRHTWLIGSSTILKATSGSAPQPPWLGHMVLFDLGRTFNSEGRFLAAAKRESVCIMRSRHSTWVQVDDMTSRLGYPVFGTYKICTRCCTAQLEWRIGGERVCFPALLSICGDFMKSSHL